MIDFGHGVQLGRILPTSDLTLRLFHWRNDPKVWKWCRQNDLLVWQDHLKWMNDPETQQTMYLIHEMKQQPLGVCGLTSLDRLNRRAEFSCYVAPEFRGDGIGRKTLQTLFTHGFKNLGLHLIWGETFEHNPAIKLFQSLGMKHEGTRRHFYFRDGKFIDALLFSIQDSEWGSSCTSCVSS